MIRVLLVTNDLDTKRLIKFTLKEEATFIVLDQRDKLLGAATKLTPHIIIIHDEDAEAIVTSLRQHKLLPSTSLVVLLSYEDETHIHTLFERGADDVIVLPVTTNVLNSRLNALIRRTGMTTGQTLRFENMVISPERFSVQVGDREIVMPKKEFQLLYLLASAPGRVFSRTEILENVWESGILVGDRTIDVHVRKIRRKLGDDSIQTVKSVGYKFLPGLRQNEN